MYNNKIKMMVHQTDYLYLTAYIKIVGWKPQLLSQLFKQPLMLLVLEKSTRVHTRQCISLFSIHID
jgi:hypothetical protein